MEKTQAEVSWSLIKTKAIRAIFDVEKGFLMLDPELVRQLFEDSVELAMKMPKRFYSLAWRMSANDEGVEAKCQRCSAWLPMGRRQNADAALFGFATLGAIGEGQPGLPLPFAVCRSCCTNDAEGMIAVARETLEAKFDKATRGK